MLCLFLLVSNFASSSVALTGSLLYQAPRPQWTAAMTTPKKARVSFAALACGLSNLKDLHGQELKKAQMAYVWQRMLDDDTLPGLLTAVIDQEVHARSYFLESCRKFNKVSTNRAVEILEHIALQCRGASWMPDTSSTGPCAMLYFALGVSPEVRIPRNKRTKEEVLQWALER